jgi:hypothetical protein
MIRLTFDLVKVGRLAQHAIAASEHKASFSDTLDGTTPAAALWFVGDEGLYLMSNGLPRLLDPADRGRSLVAYAAGFRTAEAKHSVSHIIDGSDFCEVFPLLAAQPHGRDLHTAVTNGLAIEGAYFVVEMDAETLTYYVDVPTRARTKR